MQGYEICKEIEETKNGLERLIKTYEYMPKELYNEVQNIIGLISNFLKILTTMMTEIEKLKGEAYTEGLEMGRRDGIKEYELAAKQLINNGVEFKKREIDEINNLFKQFINKLSHHISLTNTQFVIEYINRFVNNTKGEDIKVIVSSTLYEKIWQHISLPEFVKIIPDNSLSDGQIFVEVNGVLSDEGIDRFFEEMVI
ncbi:MAG: hypothetical protein N2746_12065 [Deltaproteobacteria bacterium]|nr:hypothetical protein [Deltaproteobacteria bacterium]